MGANKRDVEILFSDSAGRKQHRVSITGATFKLSDVIQFDRFGQSSGICRLFIAAEGTGTNIAVLFRTWWGNDIPEAIRYGPLVAVSAGLTIDEPEVFNLNDIEGFNPAPGYQIRVQQSGGTTQLSGKLLLQ